jgi:hypothetical protein
VKPWKCRNCSEWNVHVTKRCAECGTRRERVTYLDDPERAARQAAVCAAVPGLAGVFAELARAMRSYASFNHLDVASFDPESIVTPTGKVIVELNAAGG